MSPKAESPDIDEKFRFSVSLDHTSIHINKNSSNYDVLMDMEYTTVTSTLEYKIFDSTSISLEVPVISMNDGFLDRPLADYHEAGNFPDYGRNLRSHNQFDYYIRQNNNDWFIAEKGGTHVTDSTIGLKHIFYMGENFKCSGSYRVKVPIGDEKHGFGSGKFDHGLFILTKYKLDSFVIYLNSGFILIEDPKTIGADIKTNDVFSLFLATEYIHNKDLSFIIQFNGFTNHIKNSDIDNFDNDTVEVSLGFSYQISNSVKFEFSFSEDLTYRASAPDFTFQTGLVMNFGS